MSCGKKNYNLKWQILQGAEGISVNTRVFSNAYNYFLGQTSSACLFFCHDV